MAREAERLLDGTGWLAEPLRTPDPAAAAIDAEASEDAETLPAFLADDKEDTGEEEAGQRAVIAAE